MLAKKQCSIGMPALSLVGFYDVQANSESALIKAVNQQPVAVAIEANQVAFQLYGGGIITKECGSAVDHGVLLVGYGSENGVKFWKIKNSWGPAWGENGYVRIQRIDENEGAGKCGILTMPSYPLVQSNGTADASSVTVVV